MQSCKETVAVHIIAELRPAHIIAQVTARALRDGVYMTNAGLERSPTLITVAAAAVSSEIDCGSIAAPFKTLHDVLISLSGMSLRDMRTA